MKKIFLTYILLAICLNSFSQDASSIIPKPAFISYPQSTEPFLLTNKLSIFYEDPYLPQAAYLKENIAKQIGIELEIQKNTPTKETTKMGIYLVPLSSSNYTPEKYELNINKQTISIEYYDLRGLINGIQSLLQLIPIGQFKSANISPVHIEDQPRFSYRGMHLDVVRHIFPVSYIKKYIDYLELKWMHTPN
jgi:hexosaminidase